MHLYTFEAGQLGLSEFQASKSYLKISIIIIMKISIGSGEMAPRIKVQPPSLRTRAQCLDPTCVDFLTPHTYCGMCSHIKK